MKTSDTDLPAATEPEEPVAEPQDESAPQSVHRVRLGRIAFFLCVLVVIGGVAGFIPRWRQRQVAQDDIAPLATTTVALVSPEAGKAEDGLTLPAEVQPMLQASIFARVSGYLKKWNVDIGARVTAGQVLAEIDTPEIDRQLEQARAQLGVAQASLKLAQTTDTRWQMMLRSNTVSKQEADEKSAAVAVDVATVESERANVHRLEETQSFQRVVAPFAGVITARNVDIGDLISAGGGRELFHLAQMDTLRVYVRVPQSQAPDIQPGQAAEVLIPELPDEPLPAKVVTTSEAVSAASRTLLTELQAANPKGRIRIGSYAQVRLASVHAAPALTLPASTLLFRAEGLQVGVVNAQGIVELRKVTLGRDFGPRVEVLSGITAADKVISAPFDSLVNGMTVRVVPPSKSS
jgi:membrane fusion protein, multidrug efflux system